MELKISSLLKKVTVTDEWLYNRHGTFRVISLVNILHKGLNILCVVLGR